MSTPIPEFNFDAEEVATRFAWLVDNLDHKKITASDLSPDLQILIVATTVAIDRLAEHQRKETAPARAFAKTYSDIQKALLENGIDPGKSPLNNRNLEAFLTRRGLGESIGFRHQPMPHSRHGKLGIRFTTQAMHEIVANWPDVKKAGWKKTGKTGSANS